MSAQNPYHICGGLHFKANFPFKTKKCFECGKLRHRQSHCQLKQTENVIPAILQKRTGMSRIKNLLRSYVYWPKIDMDILNLVKSCRVCALA